LKISHLIAFLKHEFLLEVRNKFTFLGLFLYCFSSIYTLTLAVKNLDGYKWIALFWILQLFITSTSAAKSFLSTPKGRNIFYYQVVSPNVIILGKLLYYSILQLILGLVSYLGFTIFFKNQIQNTELFLSIMILGAVSLAISFTFISAIASKSNSGPALMAILGFPIIIPQLLLILKVSKNALDGLSFSIASQNIIALSLLDVMVLIVAIILFPYLWSD
jgi:heme exporter protein B